MIYIDSIILILFVIKSVDFVYLFQIKEYRFDRFMSAMREMGIVSTLYTRTPRIPAKTIRNATLMLWLLASMGAVILFLSMLSNIWEALGYLIFTPVIALCWMAVGVDVTNIAARRKRTRIIHRAKKILEQSKVTRVGITGCYGKTTTKEFLAALLSAEAHTAKTIKNWNTDVGVALSILSELKTDTRYFIAEVGGYTQGEIGSIAQWLKPQFGFFTGMGNQHVDLYGSQQALMDGETELLAQIPPQGIAYINADAPELAYVTSRCHCPVVTYSFSNSHADIYFSNHRVADGKQYANVHYRGTTYQISSCLIGSHILMNLLPCIAFCLDQHIPWEHIAKTIETLKPIPGKLSQHIGPSNSVILNDSANTNVEGCIAAIQTTNSYPQPKKYMITKGIIELGNQKNESYRRIIEALDKTEITFITTDGMFYEVAHHTNNCVVQQNESDIIAYLKNKIDQHTVITLEGKFTKFFIKQFVNHKTV